MVNVILKYEQYVEVNYITEAAITQMKRIWRKVFIFLTSDNQIWRQRKSCNFKKNFRLILMLNTSTLWKSSKQWEYFHFYFALRQTFSKGNFTQNTIWVASEPGNSTHVEYEYKIKEGMITEGTRGNLCLFALNIHLFKT